MPLFPQLGPQYYDETDKHVLSMMEAFYAESITIMQAFWAEADNDTRFEAGDQTLWNDLYGNLPVNRRRQFNFNRIRRVVNMISGHQRRNRKSTVVIPIENGDSVTADQYTKLLMWIEQQEGYLETISKSFHGSLVTGMNLLNVWVDYRTDPVCGNLKIDNCDYNEFIIDPFFKKPDLSDCKALWRRKFITKREAVSLFPEKADIVIGLYGQDNRDGKFQFTPESYNYGMKNLLTYDEFHYRDYRTQKLIVDTQTGETMEWKSADEERLKAVLDVSPTLTILQQEIPTTRVAIVVQGRVFYDGPNPIGIDSYPYVPVWAYYNPQLAYFPWRTQGVVRGLRDAQYLYNRRKAIELDILESQINSGWIMKEDALVNPKDAVQMNGQGRMLVLKQEAAMTDIQRIDSPVIPASTIELSRILAQEVSEISGVNEELLGSAVDEKAGILSMLRQGAGLTTLQNLFDQLDMSQRILGRLMLDIIQTNFTPGKVKKILQEDPSPQFYNQAFGRYEAAVEDGLNTTTQRQMQFAQLLQLKSAGVPVPDDVLLDSTTLQNKQKLIDAVAQSRNAQEQMAQKRAEVEAQEIKARIELAQARASADQGLGLERISRIQENQALAQERRAAAVKDEDLAVLNLVKAAKELQGIDLDHLSKLIQLANSVKSVQAEAAVQRAPETMLNKVRAAHTMNNLSPVNGSLGSS